MAMRRLTISRPLGVRTLRLRLRLLTFVSLKFPEVLKFTSTSCGVVELGSRPRSFSGHSILIISAPRAPSQRVAHGPARTQLKSTTRIPSSARGRDMASCSCITGHPGLLVQTAWGRTLHSTASRHPPQRAVAPARRVHGRGWRWAPSRVDNPLVHLRTTLEVGRLLLCIYDFRISSGHRLCSFSEAIALAPIITHSLL